MRKTIISLLSSKIGWARGLIAVVFIINVECAASFLIKPASYAPSYELEGALGEAVVRSLGVLFLMWNIPYAVALWHPVRHRRSLYEALAMQATGLLGESLIYYLLPTTHLIARSSILRFIIFDGLGLLALVAAAWLSWN